MANSPSVVNKPVEGAVLCIVAYGLLSLQDAAMKWVVAELPVTVSLFWRSGAVVLACLVFGRGQLVREFSKSDVNAVVTWRALVSVAAWILYYDAARHLSLAEMTTVYFSAPIFVVLLAVVLLKERASPLQLCAVALGFIGVLVASGPGWAAQPVPIVMVLAAAVFWAFGYILLRKVAGKMTALTQVFVTNLVFVLVLFPALLWYSDSAPGPGEVALLAGIGLIGGLGQLALFASFERASATILAPFEYSGLIWAFVLSMAIWGTTPDIALILGACLISVSGLLAMYAAKRDANQS